MQKDTQVLRCYCCGKEIDKIDGRHYVDTLNIDKQWGYFSRKDLERHTFTVCETCYDKWISSFLIPVNKTEVIEVFSMTKEDYEDDDVSEDTHQ